MGSQTPPLLSPQGTGSPLFTAVMENGRTVKEAKAWLGVQVIGQLGGMTSPECDTFPSTSAACVTPAALLF